MCVATDGKREATRDPLGRIGGVGILQRAAREHRFLGVVESDGAEFLPVAN